MPATFVSVSFNLFSIIAFYFSILFSLLDILTVNFYFSLFFYLDTDTANF